MKKTLLALFVVGLLFILTGCENEKKVVCTYNGTFDEFINETVVTTTFNDENYVNYQKTETVQVFENKDIFDHYVNSAKDLDESFKDNKNIEYSYSVDEKNLKITVTMVYKENIFDYIDVSQEEKAPYLAANVIKDNEDSGAKCEVFGTTREDLGIE